MIILILPLMFTLKVSAPADKAVYLERNEAIMPYQKLWEVICTVESNNNPLAYNSHEGAVGIAQIRLCRIKEYNSVTGQQIVLNDLFDPLKAKAVFM